MTLLKKLTVLSSFLAFWGIGALGREQDGPAEKAGKKVDETIEQADEKMEEVKEEAGKKAE